MCGGGGCPGGRYRVGRQVLLRWCCVHPCLDAAWSCEEVNDAGPVAGGTVSVPPLCGRPVGPPARGQCLGVTVLPGGENPGHGDAGWWLGPKVERREANRDDGGDDRHGHGYGSALHHPSLDHPAAHRLGGHPVRWLADGGLQQITQVPVYRVHWVSPSINPAS